MNGRFSGRVALVAGGTGGLGRSVSLAFLGEGAEVVVTHRGNAELDRLRSEAGPDGARLHAERTDVTDEAAVRALVDGIFASHGRLDFLVNAVGGYAGGSKLWETEAGVLDRMLDLNLRSALLPTQAAVRAMIEGGRGGRVLHISSVRGQLGIDNGFSAYVAAKGALDALTRQQATEWAKYDITVNAISPTFVRTPQVEDLLADDGFREGLYKRIPLGRIAETDDVVGSVLLLCSDASAFITGQVLTLDGGLTACQ